MIKEGMTGLEITGIKVFIFSDEISHICFLFLLCGSSALFWLSESCDKTLSKPNSMRKGFNLAYRDYSPSSRKSQGRSSKQEPMEAASWLAFLTIFLRQSRLSCLGIALPTVGCAPPYQLAIKKSPCRYNHTPI